MFQVTGQPITFVAFFSIGGVAADALAPLPTMLIKRINADGTATVMVLGDDEAVNTGNGFYHFVFTDTATPGAYVATFNDSTNTTDQITYPAVWFVGIGWAQTVFEKASLIGATQGEPVDGLAIFGDTLIAETDCRYVKTIVFPGYALAGWQFITFTIKERITQDDDGEALLTVRLTNPASVGTDGILVHNRAAIPAANALRGKASIAIVSTGPDSSITITLNADALDLPASPTTDPYTYEINIWKAGDKDQTGKGAFVLNQSVRRSTVAP